MSFWKDLWKLWRHNPNDGLGENMTNPECIPDIKPKEKTIWCVRCDENIWYPRRPGECQFHFELFHFDRSCSECRNKKKDPKESLNFGRMSEVNCPNCNMICYIGTIRDGQTKEFHCEAGEASCGYHWVEEFKLDNVHDYDIENFRNEQWEKSNWGGKDKNIVVKRAQDTAISFAYRQDTIVPKTDGVRVVDRQDNIFFEWIRNEDD